VEAAPHPQFRGKVEEGGVAPQDDVLATVDLGVADIEGGGLAAEKAAALQQDDATAAPLQLERRREAG
jgi:hypothetical protein